MNRANLSGLLTALAIAALAMVIAVGAGSPSFDVNGLNPLIYCALLALGLQWLGFAQALTQRSERYYDLIGSGSYIAVVLLALCLSPDLDARSALLALMVFIWAGRLGSFLFRRIRAQREDRRFAGIRDQPGRFLVAWTLQGLWVFITVLPVAVIIVNPRSLPLSYHALFGALLWLVGFGIEAIADAQKRRFRADPANRQQFIHSGLWAWSRHPNYFGEILLWTGVAVIAAAEFSGWEWLGLLSPVFVTLILTQVSGIPLLEADADARWGERADYRRYRDNTPVLIPRRPRR